MSLNRSYKVVLESSGTIIVITASAKEDGSKPITLVYHMTLRCEQALFLHKCLFNFMFCFVCDGCQN
jgi:hypothetical protein